MLRVRLRHAGGQTWCFTAPMLVMFLVRSPEGFNWHWDTKWSSDMLDCIKYWWLFMDAAPSLQTDRRGADTLPCSCRQPTSTELYNRRSVAYVSATRAHASSRLDGEMRTARRRYCSAAHLAGGNCAINTSPAGRKKFSRICEFLHGPNQLL